MTSVDPALEAVRSVLLRYARGVDRADLQLVLGAFHADAVADHGAGFSGNAHEAWTKRLGSNPDPMDRVGVGQFDPANDVLISCQHHITNVLVKSHGNRADSEAYFLAYYLTQRGNNQFLASVGGRYVDRFEYRDEEWRIAHRISVHDWDRVEPIAHRFPGGERWVQGRRDRQDPSYPATD